MAQEHAGLVHAHQYTPFFYATAARLPFGRTPILFTEHGRFYPDYRRPKRVLYNRWALARRDQVMGVGEVVRTALIQNEGLPAERVGVIYNGIDLSRYPDAGDAAVRQEVRREFGVADETLLAVLVARLDPIKDHATAIRAIAQLRDRAVREQAGSEQAGSDQAGGVRLLVVGEGPERAAIEREVARLGVGQLVTLTGLRRDVPRLLAGADVCLLSSVSEGIPLTIIEGMAARLPIVATDLAGLREVVSPETGLLVPVGDAAGLAAALAKLADDPALRGRLGEAGRRLAFERFDEQTMADAYARLYDGLGMKG